MREKCRRRAGDRRRYLEYLNTGAVCGRENQQLGDARRVDREDHVWTDRGRHDVKPEALLTSTIKPGEVNVGENPNHNFVDCRLSGTETAAPVEVKHRSLTICLLDNIAMRLGPQDAPLGPGQGTDRRRRRGREDAQSATHQVGPHRTTREADGCFGLAERVDGTVTGWRAWSTLWSTCLKVQDQKRRRPAATHCHDGPYMKLGN